MLHAWGFERVGVVAADLYFLDPDPSPGQEGAERGVRVEVRLLERPPLTGSIYAAQPIVVDRPVWRADLFETVAGDPGSHDRTHHHPHFRGWEPGRRQFDPALTDDPMGWLADQLTRLPDLLAGAEIDAGQVGPDDARDMAAAAPEIVRTVEGLLRRVRAGELGRAPADVEAALAARAAAARAPAARTAAARAPAARVAAGTAGAPGEPAPGGDPAPPMGARTGWL